MTVLSYTAEVLADAPGSYHDFSETSGQPQDDSGNANHTTVVNGTPIYSQPGPIITDVVNNAIRFDVASTEYFTAPDHATLDFGDVFTLEVWLKRLDTAATEYALISKGSNAGGIFLLNSKFILAKAGVTSIAASTITISETTNWHYCVATKNGPVVRLYIDTKDVTPSGYGVHTCINNTAVLGLGISFEPTATSPANVIMARPATYPTALSPTRIQAHYAAALGLYQTLNDQSSATFITETA